jgi:K+-sensing histidine kinase KdpD
VEAKKMLTRLWRPALALCLCAAGAWSLTLIQWEESLRMFVPFAFLAIILLLGALYGRLVGILGSVIAAGVFAHSMFPPLGSVRVGEQGARAAVAWMLLTGVVLSFLLLPSSKERDERSK